MTYKTLIPRQIRLLLCLAIVLSFGRVLLFRSWSLIYLLWNIFLAILPFLLSWLLLYSAREKKLTTWMFVIGTIIWLVVLPNAPYIITDLIHIGYGHASEVLYNTILIFVCALAGLSLALYSLFHIEQVFTMRYKKRTANILLTASMLLASFGVALGRFLRFNSWDIFTNSKLFLQSISRIVWYPSIYEHVYVVTGTLFLVLFVCYRAWDFKSEN
jgi:uncharacterized membrane protein